MLVIISGISKIQGHTAIGHSLVLYIVHVLFTCSMHYEFCVVLVANVGPGIMKSYFLCLCAYACVLCMY